MFAAWGHLVYRWRWATLGLSSVLLALSVVVLAQGGDLASGGIIETSESGRALQLLKDELPQSSGSSFSVIFASDSLVSTDGKKAFAVVSVNDNLAAATKYYPELRERIRSDTLSVTGTGNIAITEDFNHILDKDLQRAELVS